MNLKHRSLISFFTALFLITSTVVGYYSFLLIDRGLFRHKKILSAVAEQAAMLAQDPVPTELITHDLQDGIRFANNGKPIQYLIKYGNSHQLTNDPKLKIPKTDQKKEFTWKIIDDDFCQFEYVLKEGDTTIYLFEKIHHEFFQDIFEGVAITFAIISLLALYSAHSSTKRIISPLEDIANGAAKIKAGFFDFRIPSNSKEHAEFIELKEHLNQVFSWLEDYFTRTSNFSAEMAHEMRTPLTSILGGLEVTLRQDRTSEEYQDIITETMQGIKKLHNLTEDMLLMLKPQLVFEQQFEICSLSQTVTEVTSQMVILTESLGIVLKSEIEPNIFINGIPSLFQRLLYNLIGNSTKFTTDGGMITVKLTKHHEEIKLTVSDTGRGITKEEIKHIFERFYHGNQTGTKGTGLGLSLCKWIVELTKGEITVKSNINRKTTFSIIWPN